MSDGKLLKDRILGGVPQNEKWGPYVSERGWGTVREDYSNMKYHLVSGTKGVLMSVVFSGALAAIMVLIKG